MIRPEELEAGEIRHALVFTYRRNRKADNGDAMFMWPPAARSDGKYKGAQYPIEGMLFQLDPSLTEADFDRWGRGGGQALRLRARGAQLRGHRAQRRRGVEAQDPHHRGGGCGVSSTCCRWPTPSAPAFTPSR